MATNDNTYYPYGPYYPNPIYPYQIYTCARCGNMYTGVHMCTFTVNKEPEEIRLLKEILKKLNDIDKKLAG
jgi:hypothetical protein